MLEVPVPLGQAWILSWSELSNERLDAVVAALTASTAGVDKPYVVDLSFNRIQGVAVLGPLFDLLQQRPHLSVCLAGNYFGEQDLRDFAEANGYQRLFIENRVSMGHSAVQMELYKAATLSVEVQEGLQKFSNETQKRHDDLAELSKETRNGLEKLSNETQKRHDDLAEFSKETRNQVAEFSKEIAEFSKETRNRLGALEGFQDNEAGGVEREVTAAVRTHLEYCYPQHDVEELEVNNVYDKRGNVLIQIDGGFFLTPKETAETTDDGSVLAIVEAKHEVTINKARKRIELLDKFEKYLKEEIPPLSAMSDADRTAKLRSLHRKFRIHYETLAEWSRADLIFFFGGPCWTPDVATFVQRKGASIVVPQGSRYHVNGHMWSSFTTCSPKVTA